MDRLKSLQHDETGGKGENVLTLSGVYPLLTSQRRLLSDVNSK